MYKKLLCFLFVLVFVFMCTATGAFAVENVSFRLSDTKTEKNRLFETVLSAEGDTELAAFVASITYDSNAFEFRNAKAVSDDAVVSVNNSTEGTVKIAYLCENGVDISAGEDIIILTFKAISGGSIKLSTEQVIDKYANDLTAVNDGSTVALVTDKADGSSYTAKGEKESNSKETEVINSAAISDINDKSEYMEIMPAQDSTVFTVLCISGAALVLAGVGVLAFILGRSSAKNKNDNREVKDEKDS